MFARYREKAQAKAELKASTPRFSARMRRLDPTLAREDRNPVYQAFRFRRLTHKKKIGLVLQGSGTNQSGGAAGLAAFGAFGVLGYLILRQIQTHKFRQPVSKGDVLEKFTMPLYAGNLFGERMNAGALADVWLTGANGYDIAEAVYLEHREQNFWTGPVVSALLFLLAAAIGCLVVPGHWIAKLFYVSGCGYFFWVVSNSCMTLGSSGAINAILQQRLWPMIRGNDIFASGLLTSKRFLDFLKGVSVVFGLVVGICLFGFVMVWVGNFIYRITLKLPSMGIAGATVGYSTVAMGALILGGLGHWYATFQRRKQEKIVDDGLRQLGYVMDICLAKMTDEQDGQRIAQWYEPVPLPLVRLFGKSMTAEKLGLPIEVESIG